MLDVERMTRTIHVCCVLHNLCLMNNDVETIDDETIRTFIGANVMTDHEDPDVHILRTVGQTVDPAETSRLASGEIRRNQLLMDLQ
jgi:hypothetical protein